MKLENPNNEQPKIPEQFPSQEEIKSVFETILQGKEYKELRVISDEKGISLYEVEVALENGEKIELNYQRAKYNYEDETLPTGGQFSASIHIIYFDADGVAMSGGCVANYRDGKWEYVS